MSDEKKNPLSFFNKKPEQSETKTPTEAQPEIQRILMSEADAYIADLMKGQPKTLDEVQVKVMDKDTNVHRLSLPKELEQFEDKFVFRWLMKDKRSLDYSCGVRGWVIVSSRHFGNLPRHLFTANGSIERGDSILGFISRERAEEIRREPGEKSTNLIKGTFQKHKDDPRYYTPDASTNEAEGREVVRI